MLRSLLIKPNTSAACFLLSTAAQCLYQIDYAYSDNGKEFKGTNAHTFVKACRQYCIEQKFTRINRPQTNGKANESSVPDRYVAQQNLL
ncbi:MAG: hypothetical protein K2Y07_01960 [Nitrosomonas sp.]|nr:hypothetical protein [Nitrosomonas sp.]OQW83989.1 MAG: hypothetical protein BVN30_04420 [Proteobacteria bacterium ST_bin16]